MTGRLNLGIYMCHFDKKSNLGRDVTANADVIDFRRFVTFNDQPHVQFYARFLSHSYRLQHPFLSYILISYILIYLIFLYLILSYILFFLKNNLYLSYHN